jgi:hypothetical protein
VLAEAFTHSRYSYTEPGTLLPLGRDSVRKAAPIVLDLQNEFGLVFLQPDNRRFATRVAYDVCQSFLDHTKEVGFQIGRQTADILSDLQTGIDSCPSFKAFDIPTQSANKSEEIQHRRMQKIR